MPSFTPNFETENLFGPNIDVYGKSGLDTDYGLNPDKPYKDIHAMYGPIALQIEKIMQTALDVTHDLYHMWKDRAGDLKDDNSYYVKYMKGYYNSKNMGLWDWKGSIFDIQPDPTPEDGVAEGVKSVYTSFKFFVAALIANNVNKDISMRYIGDKYITALSTLKAELLNSQREFIAGETSVYVDIGATHNQLPLANVGATMWNVSTRESIAFTIEPQIKFFDPSAIDSIGFENSLPRIKQTVYIDINRLILLFCRLYAPDELPKYLEKAEKDKEEYVKNGSMLFKNLPEAIARKVMLELFDNHENIKNNWSYFLGKFDTTYRKFANASDIVNYKNKLKFYGYTMSESILPTIMGSFNTGNHFEDSYYVARCNETFASLHEAFFENFGDCRKSVVSTLFLRSFKTMFSSSVAYLVAMGKAGSGTIVLESYFKEFSDKYDTTVLLDKTRAISDYNTKDFFKDIIRENNASLVVAYPTKLASGENASFMAAKLRRLVWIDITCLAYLYLGLVEIHRQCVQQKPQASQTLDKMNHPIGYSLQALLRDICEIHHHEATDYSRYNRAYMDGDLTRGARQDPVKSLIDYIISIYETIHNQINNTMHSGDLTRAFIGSDKQKDDNTKELDDCNNYYSRFEESTIIDTNATTVPTYLRTRPDLKEIYTRLVAAATQNGYIV